MIVSTHYRRAQKEAGLLRKMWIKGQAVKARRRKILARLAMVFVAAAIGLGIFLAVAL